MNYSISQIAEKFDLNIHTLRYYEKEGLIPFVKRTSSGIRQFDDVAVEGIKMVECLKETGMPLKDIKTFLDWCQAGDDSLQQRKELFHERREAVLKQIADLKEVLNTIEFKCWYYDTAVEKGSEQEVWNMSESEIPKKYRALRKSFH